MKIVRWDDDDVPEVAVITEEHVLVLDSHWQFNLEPGDLVQYLSEDGTTCYHVVHVEEDETYTNGRMAWLEMAGWE